MKAILDSYLPFSRKETQVSPDTNRPFPLTGLTLSGIDAFVEMIGGRKVIADLTTDQVCQKFVKPLTKAKNCSFCDWYAAVAASNDPQKELPDTLPDCHIGNLDPYAVGTANVFISHAWKYNFLDLLEAIHSIPTTEKSRARARNSMQQSDTLYFWVDLFSNNQNIGFEPPPFDWWCGTFMNAIQKMNHVVMIIAPWENPYSLTRAWCLWEVYCAIVTNSKFSIAMCKREHDRFQQMILEKTSVFFDMIGSVDLRNSEATNPEDKQRIFEVVSKKVGINKLNRMIMKQLQEWGLEEMKILGKFLSEEDIKKKKQETLKKLGFGNYGIDVDTHIKSNEGEEKQEILKNLEYLLAYVDLLALNNYFDKIHSYLARALKTEYLKSNSLIYGKYLIIQADCFAMNLSTSDHYRYVVTCFRSKTRSQIIAIYEEGINLFKELLDNPQKLTEENNQKKENGDPESRDDLESNVAAISIDYQLLDKVKCWYVRGIQGKASCLWKTDLSFVQSAVEISEEFYGKESLETGKALTILGKAHFHFGKPELALETYEKALEIYQKNVSNSHPIILILELRIAMVQPYVLQAQKGCEMITRCSQKAKEKFDSGHPFLNTILQNSIFIYATSGNISKLFHELFISWLLGTMIHYLSNTLGFTSLTTLTNLCTFCLASPCLLLLLIPQMIPLFLGIIFIPIFICIVCFKELVIYSISYPFSKSIRMKLYYWTHHEIIPNMNLFILLYSFWTGVIYLFLLLGTFLFLAYVFSIIFSFFLAVVVIVLTVLVILGLLFCMKQSCVGIAKCSRFLKRKVSILPCCRAK